MMAGQDRAAWHRPVFVADGRAITVGEVVLAAHGWDALQSTWTRVLRQVQAEQQAADPGEDEELEADDERLQAMSEQFRYERELITAEETERWLEDRGLTLDDFNAHVLRNYWADTVGESLEPEPLDYRSAPDELWDLLVTELLLSSDLDRLARQLSWRFAAVHVQRDRPMSSEDEHRPDAVRTPDDVEGWMAGRGPDSRWLEELGRLEAAYRREYESLMTPERLERSLVSMRMDVGRVELEIVGVDSIDAVREVVMCVREDGMSMSDVASEGRYPYERVAIVFEDLPLAIQQRVLRAAPGELLEPLPHDDGFQVYRLRERTEPDLQNDDVRERVERRLLEHHFSELAASSVRWLMAPSGTV